MTTSRAVTSIGLLVLACFANAGQATADEGMWLFNEFPFERFEQAYGFRPSQEWLDHVRLSSVRFGNGGSGSFVSADGLALTNHHVAADCVQKLSSADRDLMTEGFVAATPEQELPCPDLELNVLDSIERVTERVKAAAAGKNAAAAAAARRAERSAIEKECQETTGLKCDVVELYRGGEFDLYRYRRYTDVRLVFAPEFQLGFFGGDPDNFEYPRFNVDAALFRVWEDGRPIHLEHYLSFSESGPREGEVVFVSGHPGSTGRLQTLDQLRWLRDISYPMRLTQSAHWRDRLLAFAARGEEERRIAHDDLTGVENSLKAMSGYLSGLLNEDLMARKAEQEAALKAHLAKHPELAAHFGDPWSEIAGALATYREIYPRYTLLEWGPYSGGDLLSIARRVVRLTTEMEKPSGERLPPYRDAALPSALRRLYSEAPIYPEYEQYSLEGFLETLQYQLGPTHPLVIQVLGDRTAAQVAREAVAGTRLADVGARKQMVEGGRATMEASGDPMIRLVRALEPTARELLDVYQKQVEAIEDQASAKIADLYFAVHGRETYPDATFSLRLSYGKVAGYQEGGKQVPWHTTFGGLYERSTKFGGEPPYNLSPAAAAAREKVDPTIPLDFVTTHDIIGGNSGSPVVDRQGELVGLIFDGNLYMLPNRFIYSEVQSRAISVDSRAILETLRHIYPATHLAEELVHGQRPPKVEGMVKGR